MTAPHTRSRPSLPTALGRAARRRCPRCGGGDIFRRWTTMTATCPACELTFEHAEGYWLGAIAINLAVTEAVFLAVFIGGMVLTWPDVPWGWLAVVVVAVNVVVPIVFHPISRTLWVAIERHVRSRSEELS